MPPQTIILFEVHLAPGSMNEELLSAEVRRETEAEVMTVAEARKKGFGGLPDFGPNVKLIAVKSRDAGFIQARLEGSNIVSGFRAHQIG